MVFEAVDIVIVHAADEAPLLGRRRVAIKVAFAAEAAEQNAIALRIVSETPRPAHFGQSRRRLEGLLGVGLGVDTEGFVPLDAVVVTSAAVANDANGREQARVVLRPGERVAARGDVAAAALA